jgi:hypothetical protein
MGVKPVFGEKNDPIKGAMLTSIAAGAPMIDGAGSVRLPLPLPKPGAKGCIRLKTSTTSPMASPLSDYLPGLGAIPSASAGPDPSFMSENYFEKMPVRCFIGGAMRQNHNSVSSIGHQMWFEMKINSPGIVYNKH